MDFPLVLIELFFARYYGWGAMGETDWRPAIPLQRGQGQTDQQFQVQEVAPYQSFLHG